MKVRQFQGKRKNHLSTNKNNNRGMKKKKKERGLGDWHGQGSKGKDRPQNFGGQGPSKHCPGRLPGSLKEQIISDLQQT